MKPAPIITTVVSFSALLSVALSIALSVALSIALSIALAVAPASAQDAPPRDPWSLELGFEHGVSLYRAPSASFGDPAPVGALAVRLHAPVGLGGVVRFDVLQLALARFTFEIGPSARMWLHRSGPRGVMLGGALGLAIDVRFDGPRPHLGTDICVSDGAGRCREPYDGRMGPFGMLQVDYREHGFFVGVACLARWLPHDLRSQERDGDHWSIDALLRVGGELEL